MNEINDVLRKRHLRDTFDSAPRYTNQCAHRCGSKRRDGDVFCARCYKKLPTAMRNMLWTNNSRTLTETITLCRNWLHEHGIEGDR